MARGRKAEPAELKEAKGNPGRRRIAKAPVEPRELVTVAPADLAAEARKVWDRLAPELARLKFLRETDRNAFARYCEHLAAWWAYTKALRIEGETYLAKSEHNPDGLHRVNPKFLLRERIEKRLEVLEDRFGLSPAARQQIIQRLASYTPAPPGDLFEAKQPGAPPPPAAPASPVGMLSRPAPLH